MNITQKQEFRYQFAGMVMQAIVSAISSSRTTQIELNESAKAAGFDKLNDYVAEVAVCYADALIKKLDYRENEEKQTRPIAHSRLSRNAEEKKPKWLYRLEYKDKSCGLWYDGNGKWCFEKGIGALGEECKSKTLPMGYDSRYKQDGKDWFSSCSNKEDLLHWFSLDDAATLLANGFVFTRHLAIDFHEYENETVFLKETSLYREEIDIMDLFKPKEP